MANAEPLLPKSRCYVCGVATTKWQFYMCSKHWSNIDRSLSRRLHATRDPNRAIHDQDKAYYRLMRQAITSLRCGPTCSLPDRDCAQCERYKCTRCGDVNPWDEGCADATPALCDPCAVEIQTDWYPEHREQDERQRLE